MLHLNYDKTALIHWFVVGFNSIVNGFYAALFFSGLVVGLGVILGFGLVWNDQRFRRAQYVPAIVWGWLWTGTLVFNFIEKFLPSAKRIGDVPAFELHPLTATTDVRTKATNLAILIHGTWGGLGKYDWSRWQDIAGEFPASEWQVMKYAWVGGNNGLARNFAAERLAQHIRHFREHTPSGKVFLVGHSHGGSIAARVARIVEVQGVVALGTPFVTISKHDDELLEETLKAGLIVRIVAPVIFVFVVALMSTSAYSLDSGWQAAVAAIVAGIAVPPIVYLMSNGVTEERRLLELAENDPIKGKPLGISLQIPQDEIIGELNKIEAIATATGRRIASLARVQARISRQSHFKATRERWLGFIPKPWLRELSVFGLFGGSLLFFGAVFITYDFLSPELRSYLGPWFFPAEHWGYGKVLVFALVLAIPYLLSMLVLNGRYLPAWHRATLRRGLFLAMATRVSQMYTFKAGLFGLTQLALHFRAGTLHLSDPCVQPGQLPETRDQVGLRHSYILSEPKALQEIGRLAREVCTSTISPKTQ